eukprot:TRINITY_DN8195_c0_g1_i3.p1 TRINITY_DN8195_c0_g1~~TRINITY_DN8195_c0_g1_i3.p1  ORF type:complete len:289 (-),score=56.41 TRINITY_DN8195_c0_g1_i3:160-1026(-)
MKKGLFIWTLLFSFFVVSALSETKRFWKTRNEKKSSREILLEIFKENGGESWIKKDGWSVNNEAFCEWYGIRCESFCEGGECELDVVEIDLSANHVTGKILDSWDFLPRIRYIRLNQNNLTGSFPSSLERTKIKQLDLSHNRLSGSLPLQLGSDWEQLESLDLSHNNLIGIIPASIQTIQNLRNLDLSFNDFTALLFAEDNYDAITTCNLEGNVFRCPIPEWTERTCKAVCSENVRGPAVWPKEAVMAVILLMVSFPLAILFVIYLERRQPKENQPYQPLSSSDNPFE